MKYNKIKSIKKLDIKENVYDISTPTNKNFVANGLVVHNSEFTNIAYSSCNLGSMNLTKYVKDGKFQWKEYGNDISKTTKFLNAVIDINEFPVPKIEEVTTAIRPIGLGVMGLAHTLILMGIPYNSKEAKHITEKIIYYTTMKSMETSCEIAKTEGAYPAFDYNTFVNANNRFFSNKLLNNDNEFIIDDEKLIDINVIIDMLQKNGIRNSCLTSIAPTGTISFIADVSSGVEPIFALAYMRKIEKEQDKHGNNVYEIVYMADPFFEDYLNTHFTSEQKEEILKSTSENNGSCSNAPFMTDKQKKLFITAQDLKSVEHLDILEATAINTSLSVSKTINLPETATVEDIEKVYIDAFKRGVIGVTVYRDKSREGILVHENDTLTIGGRDSDVIIKNDAPKRPKKLRAEMYIFTINKQSYYATIGFLGEDPYEVFTGLNSDDNGEIYIPRKVQSGIIEKLKRGRYEFTDSETGEKYILVDSHSDPNAVALTRSISTSLRHGVDPEIIVSQIEKIKGDMNVFAKVISRMIKKYIKDGTKSHGNTCQNCGNDTMVRKEGCLTCSSCGRSLCS